MEDREIAVRGGTNIELDHIRPKGKGRLHRGNRVFEVSVFGWQQVGCYTRITFNRNVVSLADAAMGEYGNRTGVRWVRCGSVVQKNEQN
jgi:hypothetical protein